jgi:hypothetical protein
MSDERSDLISQTMPVQVSVEEMRIEAVNEGSPEYKVEFTDPQGVTQTIRVSKRFYRQTSPGDTITVYPYPRSDGYIHESDPFAFAKASTSMMWAVGWILIFIGVLDILMYPIIEESPWCLVIQSWGPSA